MQNADSARHEAGGAVAMHLQGGHWPADRSSQAWTLLPGELDCWLCGLEFEASHGGNRVLLSQPDSCLTLEGRTRTPLFCQLDEAVRTEGRLKSFRVRFYDGMVRLEGPFRLQRFDPARMPEESQALHFQARLAPAGQVQVLNRPCDGHPDFGLWRNPELGLLEFWWRDRLVTAVDAQGNGAAASWKHQVVAYLEETASASHAAVTFLAQLRRLGAD